MQVGGSWSFTDNSMGGWGVVTPEDGGEPASKLEVGVMMSTIKLRQAGFHTCMDSVESIMYWLRRMQDEHVLPR